MTRVTDRNAAFYQARLSVDITREQQRRMQNLIQHGLQRPLFSAILDSVLDAVEQHGQMAIAAIIDGKVSFLDIMKAREE